LSALARTEKEIDDLLSDPSVSSEQKLLTYTKLAEKFDKLRPNSGTAPRTTTPTAIVLPPALPTPINLVEEPAAVVINIPEADLHVAPAVAVQDEKKEEALDVLPAAELVKKDVINLPKQYLTKYSKLKLLIDQNPNIISSSPTGELIIHGNLLVNSSYSDLIRESYVPNKNHNLLGQNFFLNALREIHVDPALLSNSTIINHFTKLNPTNNSLKRAEQTLQFGKGQPPGKRPCSIMLYRK